MLRIGLTGGIASGKSTVASLFARLGATVVSADRIVHQLLVSGTPEFAAVIDAFGSEVIDLNGEIDRAALGRRVFADPDERTRLESILHPPVRARMAEEAAAAETPYVVLEIPLLVETGMFDGIDRVLVVDCPEQIQLERLAERDGRAVAESRRILASQASRLHRIEYADDIIVNDRDLATLQRAVQEMHTFYLRLAAAPA